ncbi:MAG TPA: Ig-like domain-containing protein, partial [Acidimicrobiales bacterium]|nr:Ig-like domain-containing protein [Acidimicrobiales bacterium]
IVVTADTNPLCSIVLPATTCSPPESAVPVQGSAYTVSASYPGDANFSRSTSSPAQTLTVAKASTTTTLTISSPTVTYGNEDSLIFTATVSPAFAGTPTGTVNVLAGSTQLCSITLPATQCMTTDDPLEASGTANAVTANYVGDANFVGSPSSTKNLTVDQVSTTTSLNVSPSTIPFGSESTVTFTATVSPQSAGSDATGVITVATPSTTLCTIDLSSAASCSTSQTALGAGAYTITATYSGNTNFTSSSSTQGLTVNQATPSPPGIANLPSGAAEEGSFVASVATSGDGSRSVVSQTTGTCTVGSDGVTVSFLVAGACTLTPQVSSGHNFIGATGSPETFSIAFGPRGYWLVGSDGGIFSFGSAQFYGSMGATPLQRPVVGITPTHDKRGYWLVASDGGIFSFGDSNFYGSIPALGLHPAGSGLPNSLGAPIVGMVPSSDGNGYFMVASDGGVFAFGDARFAGSCPGIGGCAGSAVAVMPDHSGNGYWLVTSTGDIYAFGDAPFFGSPSPQPSPVVNAVATPDGHGYWILYANGAVVSFGDAPALGAPVGYVNGFNPATSIFPTTDGLGYWVASAHGDVFSYGNAPFLGSMSATPLNGPIIAAFGF